MKFLRSEVSQYGVIRGRGEMVFKGAPCSLPPPLSTSKACISVCAVPSSVKTPVPSPQRFHQNPTGHPGTAISSQSPALPGQPRGCRTDATMSVKKGGLGELQVSLCSSSNIKNLRVAHCNLKHKDSSLRKDFLYEVCAHVTIRML